MRRRTGLRPGLSVALLVSLGVTGIVVALTARGGHVPLLSKAEYEQSVRAAYWDVRTSFRSTRDASSAELAARVTAAQSELRRAADRLERLAPPPSIRRQNQALVDGMRAYAGDLDVVRGAAERRDRAAIAQFNAGLGNNRAIARIAEAAEEMTFQGYDLGPIAEE
jgi:hypothetical protein